MSVFTLLQIHIKRETRTVTDTAGTVATTPEIAGSPFIGRLGRRSAQRQFAQQPQGTTTIEAQRIVFFAASVPVQVGDFVEVDACAATGNVAFRAQIEAVRPYSSGIQCDLTSGNAQEETVVP